MLYDWELPVLIAVVVSLVLVLAVWTANRDNKWEEWCQSRGGHMDKAHSTGWATDVTGKGGVSVTSSTTHFCLTEDGRVLGVR